MSILSRAVLGLFSFLVSVSVFSNEPAFSQPESAYFHSTGTADPGVYFISSTNGNELGWVSKLAADGSMIDSKEIVLTNPEQNGTSFSFAEKSFRVYGLMPYPTTKMKEEGDIDYYLRVEIPSETSTASEK